MNIPASRAPLFARSPFLEFQAIVPERGAQMMIASAPDDKRAAVEATVRASVDYAAAVRINISLKSLLSTKSGYIYL